MSRNFTVGIVGGGAVGLAYAALLSEVTKVIVKTRRQDQADRIQADGISLTIEGTPEQASGVDASPDAVTLAACDAVLITVKSYDTTQVTEEISSALKPDAVVVSLQNGMQALPILRANLVNPARVFGGVTYVGATRKDENGVTLGNNRRTVIDYNASILVDVIGKSRFGVEASPDISQAIWDKMVLNTGQNALGAITDLTLGEMLESEHCLEVAEKLLAEFQAVAKAEGITFDYSPMEKLRDNWKNSTFHPSMWQDLQRGNKTEIDAINGAISELGVKHKVPTPYNDMVVSLVKVAESRS